MGNNLCKMSCFNCQEEVHSQETPGIDVEIPVQVWNENEQPENSIETPDPSDFVEVRGRGSPSCISLIPLAESPVYSRRESFRLKVMGEHVKFSDGIIKKNYHQFYDSNIPVSLSLNSDHMNCIYQVSLYNSRRERTVDMTLISGMTLNPMIKHIIYWKGLEENSWQLNVFSEGSHNTTSLFYLYIPTYVSV